MKMDKLLVKKKFDISLSGWKAAGRVLTIAGLLVILLFPVTKALAFSGTGCEGDCTKCHSLDNQEVKEIFQNMKIPQAEVLKIQISPIKGLWEVSIDNKGNRGLFYVDFSKKFLLPGPIIEIKTGTNKTTEQVAKLQPTKKVDFSKIPLQNALVMGDKKAPLKFVIFTDPDCPYCGKLHEELAKLAQERTDISFHILMFPLMMHKDAYWKSKSIVCNKSLKMLEEAFAHKEIPKTECNTKEIDNNIKLGESLGITGTPTIIFPDGRVHTGFLTAKQVLEFMQEKK